jgi:predicted PurR-regulated permease PerM
MCISKGWSRLVLPGILVGLWGYVIGTPIGILLITALEQWARR